MHPNSPCAWLLAARPKTLTAAVVPVMLGCALAYADRQFQTEEAVLCLLFACLMQVAANFINDLFDFRKGSDRSDRLGPQRACIGTVLILACACGLGVLYCAWGNLPYGGWELIGLGVLCLLFAFLYTTVLSYRGWGDVLVLVFFGFVPVGGTYYVQTGQVNWDVCLLSLVSGLVIDTLLMVNNYRDREQDRISGKQTLVVRFGEKFGAGMYLGLGLAAIAICAGLVFTGRLTWL